MCLKCNIVVIIYAVAKRHDISALRLLNFFMGKISKKYSKIILVLKNMLYLCRGFFLK